MDEPARLAALERYNILDTPPEVAFDRITALASNIFKVPIAIIGFIDERRQWYKSAVGVSHHEVDRELSFCRHTIVHNNVLVIPDARRDQRYADNPSVTGEPYIRFYAGCPLCTADGYALGTLCIIDSQPREPLTDNEIRRLTRLAAIVVDELELRSALKKVEEEKRQRLQTSTLLEHFFMLSDDLFCIAGSDGYFQQLNAAWQKVLGLTNHELTSQPIMQFVHPDDRATTQQVFKQLGAGNSIHEFENRYRSASGSYHWLRWTATADSSARIYASARDVTATKIAEQQLQDAKADAERAKAQLEVLNQHLDHLVRVRTKELEKANAQLLYDAFHDTLTGLPNRALLHDRLTSVIARESHDPNHSFAVLYLDIDRFKVINDSLGRSAGDTLLVDIGQRLRHSVSPGDTVARLGGDEFAILLDNLVDLREACQIANHVLTALLPTLERQGYRFPVSASIGIVYSHLNYSSAEAVLRDADIAMYHAKSVGKAGYQVFTQAMRDRAQSLLELENDLRKAIERQELSVHYQPIIALDTNNIVGFEALLRWQHSTLGPISPAEFIPVAEETGIILELDRWVLGEACQQVYHWQRTSGLPLTISVNLSGHQFMQYDLVDTIQAALTKTGLAPHQLKIELTESILMQHSDTVTATLKKLKALDVSLHLDDFGTGYSSLAYLQRFPVDVIKIDRSFVTHMDDTVHNAELVIAILAMANSLNLKVVAEGVETSSHARQLRALGCSFGQGYYFAKPLPPKDIVHLLHQTNPSK